MSKQANRTRSPAPEALETALAAVGKKTCWYRSPDGSALLLLPYGRGAGPVRARRRRELLLGPSGPGRAESARGVFASTGWQNTGGDRTWLSPEIDIFFPDYPRCQQHAEPATLDAAPYTVEARAGGVAMTRAMTLHFARARRPMKLRLTKWVGPAANPLRHEPSAAKLLDGVQYAAYTQRTAVKLLGESARQPLPTGIWNLIQLPHGGELIVPTYWRTQPRVLFGDFPPVPWRSRTIAFASA